MKITLEKVKQIILDYDSLLEENSMDAKREELEPIVKAIDNGTLEIIEEAKGEDVNEVVFDGVKYVAVYENNNIRCAFKCGARCPLSNCKGFYCAGSCRKDGRDVVLKKKED